MAIVKFLRATIGGASSWRPIQFGQSSAINVEKSRAHLVAGEFFPTDDNTGVISEISDLQVVNGNVGFTTDGQTISGRLFLGDVTVNAKNVTFKDCYFRGSVGSSAGAFDTYQIAQLTCTAMGVENLLVEDCTFDASYGSGLPSGQEAVYRTRFARNSIFGHHFTLRRCNIKYGTDNISIVSVDSPGMRADARLEGNYITDMTLYSPDTNSGNATHNDCIQWHGGKGVVMIGNRMEGFMNNQAGDWNDPWDGTQGNQYHPSRHVTSVLMLTKAGSRDAPDECVISKNWINGGGAGLVISGNAQSFLAGPNSVEGNYFGYDYRNGSDFGILAKSNQVFTLSGNRRWGGPISWLHSSVGDFETGVKNPFDTSTAFNVRKNG